MGAARLSNRKFGLIVGIAFCCASGVIHYLFDVWFPALLYLGAGLAVLGAVVPGVLLPLNLLWHAFGIAVFQTTNFLLLGLVYWVLITPIGLFMRLIGRDQLDIRPAGQSTWAPVSRKMSPETSKDLF